jgi:radical SAM superfamily enzyme
MKKIIMPSTFSRRKGTANMAKDAHTLDLDSIFWEYVFSKGTVKSLFDEYISLYNTTDEFKNYLDFIIANLDTTNAIKNDVFSLPFEEKRSLYCFKVCFFILSIFNKINRDYTISLPYGVFFNHPIKDIEDFIDNKNIISGFFDHVLNSNSFFENNNKYTFKIYWENEVCVVLLLAHKMRKKFDNVKITVDLSNVNEQADFSFWQTQSLLNKYIDGFENVYHNGDQRNKSNVPELLFHDYNNHKRLVTRLFDTKCYWGKCSFCAINSRFTSEKKVEKLDEYAIQKIDNLVAIIKKSKDLSSLVFTDEAIEPSILIYFAEQLLKHEINIIWNIRTRFSDKFTLDNCRILSQSGLRFLGFGLESANQRVLELMNKYEREYSKGELNNILENCDKVGINTHAYFIMGFPSETKQETDETLEFLDYQFKNRKYFTYTANVFYLMKGSYVYKHPEKYNIQIDDKHENVKLANINFIDNNPGEKYARYELEYLSRKAYAKLFFKEEDLDYAAIQTGDNFWYFLERTGLFYEHKLVNSYNPYLSEVAIDSLTDAILDRHFKLLPLFISSNNANHEYYNILNERRVSVSENIKDVFVFFVTNFNSGVTLRENIVICFNKFNLNENKKNLFEKYVIKLIKDAHLYIY